MKGGRNGLAITLKNSTEVTSKKRLKKSKVTQSKGSESLYDKVSDEMAFQILSMRRGIPAPTPVTAQHISTRHYTLAPTQTSPQHHEHTATRQDTSPPTTTQKHSDKRPYTPAPTQPDTPAPTQHTATNLHMAAPTQTVPKYPAARPQHHEHTATRQDTPPPTVTTPQYPTTIPTTMWTTSTPAYTPPAQTPQHHERTATRQDTPPPTVTTPQYPATRPTTMVTTSTPAYTPPAQTPQYPFIPTYENQPQHTSFDEPTNWYHGYGQTYSALLDHVDSPEPITHQGMQCQCGEVLARVQALEFEVNHLREQAQSGQSAMSLPKNKKFNGLTLEEIKDHVNGMNVTAAVKYLMNHLFKPEELVTKTIRGQATHNQKGVKKESLPENIVSMIIDIVKSQHKSVTLAEITTKIRNRIKMMRQQAIFD